MQWLLVITCIGIVITALWVGINLYKCASFRRKLKPGQHCHFFINETRHTGTLTSVDGHSVLVSHYNTEHNICIKDLYP